MTKFSIHDPIHGSVDLSEEEKKVIEHRYFQRLRRVKALGFLDRVFPSAKHSRFEHSIGACHVAGLLFDSLKEISLSLADKDWFQSSSFVPLNKGEIEQLFSEDIKKYVRIAALLHDVGHGPFSHASESIMPPLEELISKNENLPDFVVEALKKSKKKKVSKGKGNDPKADHEDYSLILMAKILKDTGFEEPKIQLVGALKSEFVDPPSEINSNHVKLFHQLIDGEIDSDRMDYLLRDSFFCGVPYGKYDLKRLREGLCIVKEKKQNALSLGILRKALTAFEDFLFSRFQMHVQIYTHKVDASFNQAFKAIAQQQSHRKLPACIDEYVQHDDESMVHIYKDNELQLLISDRKKWKMAIQTYGGNENNDAIIFDAILEALEKDEYSVYESERLFKKATLLELPVICEGFGDKLIANKMTSSSQLITHYNAIFQVKRLFYKPEAQKKVDAVIQRMNLQDIDVPKELDDTKQKLKKIRRVKKKVVGDI